MSLLDYLFIELLFHLFSIVIYLYITYFFFFFNFNILQLFEQDTLQNPYRYLAQRILQNLILDLSSNNDSKLLTTKNLRTGNNREQDEKCVKKCVIFYYGTKLESSIHGL